MELLVCNQWLFWKMITNIIFCSYSHPIANEEADQDDSPREMVIDMFSPGLSRPSISPTDERGLSASPFTLATPPPTASPSLLSMNKGEQEEILEQEQLVDIKETSVNDELESHRSESPYSPSRLTHSDHSGG